MPTEGLQNILARATFSKRDHSGIKYTRVDEQRQSLLQESNESDAHRQIRNQLKNDGYR